MPLIKSGHFPVLHSREALLSLGLLFVFSPQARAINRTVYFTTTGVNRTAAGGVASSQPSTCQINVSNPSAVTQSIVVKPVIQNIDVGSNSLSTVTAPVPLYKIAINASSSGTPTTNNCGGGNSNCTATLPGGGSSVTFIFPYDPFPADTQGSQTLRCSGSIQASDVTTPGFVTASGTLVTFVESSEMHTDSSTATSVVFGGTAIYSAIPIVINRAKPF